MKISEVSQLTGLSISNIRFYERKGLLMPERQKESKYRDYSNEDIKVLKEIILYRKMNISIETIYLLQQGEVSLQTVLNRQEEELLAERQRLEGAIDLCRKIQAEQDVSRMDIDYYLNYVYEEETNGKKFAEIYELLDDVADFSHMPQFVGDPHVGKFFANSNIRRVLSILLPWISSLLVRDQTLLLPLATLVIQFLPQIYPYLHYFKKLNLPKQPVAMIAPMFISNGIFVLMLPSGVGLYYFISGLFTAVEQLVTNLMRVKREKILA